VIIAFDMDGVLCDHLTPWLHWLNTTFDDNLRYEDLKGYRVIDQAKAGERATEFLYLPGVYDHIEPMPGMLEVLKFVQDSGHRPIIATKASHNPNMIDGKAKWFKRNAPFISHNDIIFIQDKSLVRASALIDDDPRNLEAFPEEKILFIHPYNRDYDKDRGAFRRANSPVLLKTILEALMKSYD
jgi:5'-nucleotidase